jgi:hypothetical protein
MSSGEITRVECRVIARDHSYEMAGSTREITRMEWPQTVRSPASIRYRRVEAGQRRAVRVIPAIQRQQVGKANHG